MANAERAVQPRYAALPELTSLRLSPNPGLALWAELLTPLRGFGQQARTTASRYHSKQVLQRELEYPRITGGLYPPEITAGQCDECGLLCIRCSPVAGAVE